jgi:antitoxin component YwqK of YwqJK toxin-antitoxin module
MRTRLMLLFCTWLMSVPFYGQLTSDSVNHFDRHGKKHGFWKKYSETGLLLYEGHFEHDTPSGLFIYYYPDEKVRAESYFYDNGNASTTKAYHHNGVVMTVGNYRNREKDSTWKYFDQHGNLLKEEFYRNGRKEGVWKTFYDNGRIAEETTWDGEEKHGMWKQYFYDGIIKATGHYVHNEMDGTFDYHFPNGRLKISGSYSKGLKTGEWITLNEESRVIKKEIYLNGRLIEESTFE